jgi:hypothetical protein
MADVRAEFQQGYRRMLQCVRDRAKPTAVCTVYDSVPGLERREQTGLCLFNDAILREAFRLSIGCGLREQMAEIGHSLISRSENDYNTRMITMTVSVRSGVQVNNYASGNPSL